MCKLNHLNTLFLLTLLSVAACQQDDDDSPPPTNTPIVLECRYDNTIVLTNQNPDGIDYIAECPIEIFGEMTIEAGTVIAFDDGAWLETHNNGALRVIGTADEPVRLTNRSNNIWGGIYINTNNTKNTLQHLIIEKAGGEAHGTFNQTTAGVTAEGHFSMTNTTITDSEGVGLLIKEELNATTIGSFSGNTFRNNALYPLQMNQNHLHSTDLVGCTFTNNGASYIALNQDDTDRLTYQTTIEKLAIPYLIHGEMEIYAPLTVEAGTEIVFEAGSGWLTSTDNDHFLRINGTETNHVVMRGKEPVAGYWAGIFLSNNSSNNVFDYLDISDGGSKAYTFANFKGNISLEDYQSQAKLTLNNCTSTRSSECDVVLSNWYGNGLNFVNNSLSITTVCED